MTVQYYTKSTEEANSMYCPECKSEYVEGILKCADCGVQLVEHLPGEPGPANHAETVPEMKDLVTFRRYRHSHEAEVAKGLLETNGIPAIVSWEDWGRLGLQTDLKYQPGVRLLVKDEDKKDAEEVFKQAGIPPENETYSYVERDRFASPPQREKREKLLSRLMLILFIMILLAAIIRFFR
ncbi:MAG: DUF2007 domain-containing protein [bacterium]|nr:DUF2007 domain-containing protein [bacterium]